MEEKRNDMEQKKERLKSYTRNKKKLDSLKEQKNELDEKIKSVRAMVYSGMPHGSSKKTDLSDYMVKLEKMEEKISRKIDDINKNFYEIEEAIAELEDGNESEIIRMRYISGMDWEKIGEEIEYSTRQVHNLHGKALKNIKL